MSVPENLSQSPSTNDSSGNKKPSATLLNFIRSAPSVHERLALGIRPPSPETRQRQMSEVIRTLEGGMAASFEIGKV